MATLLERLRRAYEMGADHGSLQLIGPMLDVSIGLDLTDVQGLISSATAKADANGFRKQRDEARVDLARETGQHVATRADLDLARKGVVEEQARADGLLKDVCALEIERDDLRAQVAQMTSGVPVGWLLTYSNGDVEATAYDDRRASVLSVHPSTKAEPLFLATNGGPQAAELAAKLEALGIELAREKRMREETRKDLVAANDEVLALKARVATLLSGERLTKDALAAAEKGCDNWKDRALLAEDAATKAIKDRAAAESDVRHLKDETRRMEREASVNLSRLTDARRCVEAAESRLRDLETSAEPAAWGIVDSCNVVQGAYLSNAQAEEAIADLLWSVAPLYRHPPKTGEPVAWLVRFPFNSTEGMTACAIEETADKLASLYNGQKIALYEAPPPAALAIWRDAFVIANLDDQDVGFINPGARGGSGFVTSSKVEAQRASGGKWAPFRLVPIGTHAVNIPAIRTVIADLRETFPTQTGEQSARLLLAAIGEKA